MFRLNTIKNTANAGDTFDLRYIALFKTKEEADAYEFIKGANFAIAKDVYDLGDQIDISYLNTHPEIGLVSLPGRRRSCLGETGCKS